MKLLELNKIYNVDCLGENGLSLINNKSIDLILCDLPYGTTRNKWDSIIPLDVLWRHYKRIIKDNGAIVLTAQTPFDKVLGNSNLDWLRYEWIWEKTTATGHLNAKKMPMKAHENVLVFYKNLPTYNPQKTIGHKPVNSYTKHQDDGSNYGKTTIGICGGGSTERYPRSVLKFSTDKQKLAIHPTQKPVDLFRYFIRTYTNKGDIVLDNASGSGTTAVACLEEERNYICFEKEREYWEKSIERVSKK
ncbi:DNA-methyltransferase [Paenibacillus chitinolyticus]|uniref:Methyltransferase n=1 Tax=Paenibacillus chitinolyticus TaxID=79263 RepID=A0ABT4FMT7_9BACL|nr:site-specific DNA-methyltransferase [Paenibacillus chitinolyticus]MCY9592367.1 site-specific DNA-methyltransferase [Paenibacillus chitinolyticus]MCY9599828.1 site-specific DNA-methyltransferase [Paenibacillus chitinolyticus]